MDFLVHHEFGLHVKTLVRHRRMGGPAGREPEFHRTLAGGLVYFLSGGDQSLRRRARFLFFCYEDYRSDPRGSLLSLCPFIGVAPEQMECSNSRSGRRFSQSGPRSRTISFRRCMTEWRGWQSIMKLDMDQVVRSLRIILILLFWSWALIWLSVRAERKSGDRQKLCRPDRDLSSRCAGLW